MKFRHIFKTAIRGLGAQKVRSSLTILGIVIGVAAIVIIMSLGEGAQKLIVDQVGGLGPETVTLRAGEDNTDIASIFFVRSITKSDVDALLRKQNVPNLVSASPSLTLSDPIEYRGNAFRTTIIGGDVSFFADALNMELSEGVLYTETDIKQKEKVIVLGETLRKDIFGNEQAIGKHVQIKGNQFRVTGVFAQASAIGPVNMSEVAFIPHTTAQTYITGSDYFNEVILRADNVQNLDKMVFDINKTMRTQHNIMFGEKDDFNVQTQEDVLASVNRVVSIFTAFLVAVVAISLIVGGIGIMNIMLVSVSERTKEIGLRKAVGARNEDILLQFLTEAMVLTGIGGVFGVLAGGLFSSVITVFLIRTVSEDWTFSFPIFGALLGVCVSVLVGLIFGIYPAHEASKKSPIEALRYE